MLQGVLRVVLEVLGLLGRALVKVLGWVLKPLAWVVAFLIVAYGPWIAYYAVAFVLVAMLPS